MTLSKEQFGMLRNEQQSDLKFELDYLKMIVQFDVMTITYQPAFYALAVLIDQFMIFIHDAVRDCIAITVSIIDYQNDYGENIY